MVKKSIERVYLGLIFLFLYLPIVVLIVVCVFALLYVGGIFDGLNFVDAFGNTDATVGLPWGGLIVVVLTMLYMVARRLMTFKEAMDCFELKKDRKNYSKAYMYYRKEWIEANIGWVFALIIAVIVVPFIVKKVMAFIRELKSL